VRRHVVVVSLLVCALASVSARAQEAGAGEPAADLGALAVGVAPFEEVVSAGAGVPDVAAALADGIAALGVGRTVGPAKLGAPQLAEPTPERVRGIAAESQVDAVVVGRTTRLGSRVSVDVRLRSGRSGAVVGTYVGEIAPAEPLEPLVARLSDQILSGLLALSERESGPRPPRPSSPPASPAAAPATVESTRADVPFGLEAIGGEQPLSIRSDELEATENEGARTLVFRRGVEVRRGDLTLRADWLQAFYPPQATQPRDLSARGAVTVVQGTRSARCDRADYEQAAERIVCSGNAELRDSDDRIRGERIVFELADRRVQVDGDVQLLLQPRPRDADPEPLEQPTGMDLAIVESDAPLAITSDRLEALERDGHREILFEGNVEVARADVTLRSDRLEALYPDRARQPDRLVATGGVAFTQGTREARCERATYHRAERLVECAGDAELWDGEDRVRGEMIAFDLDTEKVVVKGRTRLQFNPDAESGETAIP